MRKLAFLLLSALALFARPAVQGQTPSQTDMLARSVERDLTEGILPFWREHTVDPGGGFYGTVAIDGTPRPGDDKGAILNARILWTFSRAYRAYGLPSYREAADRAAVYFRQHFVDPKYGGAFWTVDSEGVMKDATKQIYASAFGIYGLAEHFRATGDPESLAAARELFRFIQDKAHDGTRRGYIEVLARNGSRTDVNGVDGHAGATKTMNTHIHLLEGLTCLYLAWPDPEVKAALKELLEILQTRLYDAGTKHLILYCDDDWKPLEQVASFGHDIETSWLMCEAAEALGEPQLLESVRRQAVEMVDTALAEGLNAEGAMRYERTAAGYRDNLSWWPQCETVIGCINAWQITGRSKYFDAAERCWDFISAHFIDREHGGWYNGLTSDGKPAREPKASLWNCPYHSARVGFELRTRLQHPAVHTEVMAWSNITGVRSEGELIDFESSVRAGVPGGKMEASGRERQSGVRYTRSGAVQTTVTPLHAGATVTQTVEDVDASTVRINWEVSAEKSGEGGVYFCMAFSPRYYANARIRTAGRKVTVSAPERSLVLTFSKPVKMSVREENGDKVLYVTLLPRMEEGAGTSLSAELKVAGTHHHEAASIALDLSEPGREFAGFGGNFRIQNVRKDPEVIDYCLNNMRVAFGRVEFPWAQWDPEQSGTPGAQISDHIRRSAEMARRLRQEDMPVIVSAWFPPEWAADRTTRSDGTSRAWALKPALQDRIFSSIASYLIFLKKEYGVEADYFSFNESDLGIDVVHTPEQHRDFIKYFGKYLLDSGLKTRMLLGDNSDATTFDFIVPTLEDPAALRYVGAVSFHSWRGCDDATLRRWADAAQRIGVPLIVAEGSTDAAAHQYPAIFNESTFALYEINLYTRICAICQPLSILQWQLTSDYSPLWGDGIYDSDGPLRPTQRFWNLRQLSLTPAESFAVPADCDKQDLNVAAFFNVARGEGAVHIVNNAASCPVVVSGLPASATQAVVHVTNASSNSVAQCLPVTDGRVELDLPAESFISIFVQ
ncbi:MAG: AGE family epimerase/isomerase [Bacteroidales bacterium]|nr:AGE family epimerase/isomerase [Bacteroidales bacterium]